MIAAALLTVALAYLAATVWRGRLFVRVRRGPIALRWAQGLWIGYALPALVALAMIGRVDALYRPPREFDHLAAQLRRIVGDDISSVLAIGMALGTVLTAAIAGWRAWRGKSPFVIGGTSAVHPRRRRDLIPAAVLAASAGVAEELFFRLLVPLLCAIVLAAPVAGFALSLAGFALLHRYQGVVGAAASLAGGAVLTVVYLASGRLWLAVAMHGWIDLNALVLRPAIAGAWRRMPISS